MLTEKLIAELESLVDMEVFVEINGVQYPIHRVEDNSQGVTLIVDLDEEESRMRATQGINYDDMSDNEEIDDFLDRARNGGAI